MNWRWPGRAVFLLVLAVLFAAYLRLSKTYPENSDEANILLMASDLAHGNLYLSGWNVSDVPFITNGTAGDRRARQALSACTWTPRTSPPR